ncbi:hypothetical protein SETIT_6G008900v2 [Setaria italica]|uniref:Uncharacterized protein n=1 Tax=Setaria italica TaxID=4555 RepID=A0A368RGX3_SETIT|nr:hypothetical protein SETIT_6G008900v2 [Setaria italica]RCV29383.1 hypothetical protein SETIT_6G008900v2 [Setaria italica]
MDSNSDRPKAREKLPPATPPFQLLGASASPRTPFPPLARAPPRPNRVHAMGKEEKGARAAEMDSSLGKARLLEATDSVCGGAEADVTSDASNECEHFYFDTEEMYKFSDTIKRLKANPQCMDCKAPNGKLTLEETKSRFVMCSCCSQCFCAGLVTNEEGPMSQSHARSHANSKECHPVPVVLWIDQPDAAYCFQCDHSLSLKVIASAARAHEPYVIRGMQNEGYTCFVNALVQCLLALGKLRMWMFGPDAPMGPLGVALKDLFVETTAGKDAVAPLNPAKLLGIGALNAKYKDRSQQDSQELLLDLRYGLNEEELLKMPPYMQDVPTVVESIFQGQVSETLTCKTCSEASLKTVSFCELSLTMPPDGYPTKSEAPQRSGRKARKGIRDLFQQIRDENKHKSADEHKIDSLPSIEECLEYYFEKEAVIRSCDSCAKHEEPSTSPRKVGGQMMASIKKRWLADWVQTERDHRKAKSDLFGAHDNQNASTLNVGEAPNEQKGIHADKTLVLSKLPPVLTLHVVRFEGKDKRPGHVKFEENLDVGKYLDPRSEDKNHARYRLVGAIEHFGNSLKEGHYVAYVRGSRTGTEQQQSSGSSTWFWASDLTIREVPLANVLKCEAYLLFYERIED